MWIVITLLIVSISINILLFGSLIYKNNVIDDLKISKSRLMKRQACEILDLLGKVRRILVNYTEHATRDTQLRYFIDESEEKYEEIIRQKNKELNTNPADRNA